MIKKCTILLKTVAYLLWKYATVEEYTECNVLDIYISFILNK